MPQSLGFAFVVSKETSLKNYFVAYGFQMNGIWDFFDSFLASMISKNSFGSSSAID